MVISEINISHIVINKIKNFLRRSISMWKLARKTNIIHIAVHKNFISTTIKKEGKRLTRTIAS